MNILKRILNDRIFYEHFGFINKEYMRGSKINNIQELAVKV